MVFAEKMQDQLHNAVFIYSVLHYKEQKLMSRSEPFS